MKKIFYSLMAATLCLMMTSCGNLAERIKSIAEDIDNNGNEWTEASQWESIIEDVATACCDFFETEFTEEELEEFNEAYSDYWDALRGLDRKPEKAYYKAQKNVAKNKELKKRLEKALKAAEKHAKKEDMEESISGAYSYLL